MIAGLPAAFDPSTLPLGARIAQVVLAGTAVAYAATRTVNARADLMLVIEMVHGDLTADVRAGLLPPLDPQLVDLERTLSAARRLAPAAAAQQAVQRGTWWEPFRDTDSVLTGEQQSRLDGYRSQLDRAAAAYRRVARPWWQFRSPAAPRHFHGNQRPRTLHASATPRRASSRTVIRRASVEAVDQGAVPLSSGIPAPRLWERNLLFDGVPEPAPPPQTHPAPAVLAGSDRLLGIDPPPEENSPVRTAITVAISRSRGIDPSDTHDVGHEVRPHIDLGQSGRGEALHR